MCSARRSIEDLGRRAAQVREQELPSSVEEIEIVHTPRHLIQAARSVLDRMRQQQTARSAEPKGASKSAPN